jgi:serine/threonine protein kinase
MSPDVAPNPTEPATRAWAAVGERLESFARAWDAGADPPDPAAFLPPGPRAMRRLILVELVKFDIERRLQCGAARPVEDYLRDFPELADGGPPCDLLYEDYHLRRQAGETVDPGDYFRRFPGRAGELARLFEVSVPARSTAVLAPRVSSALVPGDRLDDFDLLALLGEGHFAKVFLARQNAMQRLVALKVSAKRGAEAETLAQLDHPNIVRVYDQRFVTDPSVQLVYMPYLAGGTLLNVLSRVRAVASAERTGKTLLEAVDAVLSRRGELPPAESAARRLWAGRSWPAAVCALGVKLAGALDYAHRRGVLHRDVKPANVLLTAEGEPMLADFNVGCCSKLEGAGPAAFFGGSLAYMAPEHLEAFNPAHPRQPESLDGRADLFSLAVSLWELLTGERPFAPEDLSGDWTEMLDALAAQRRAGPNHTAVAELPEGDAHGLRDLLVRCLDAEPDRRPADAAELARELELCLKPATRSLVRPEPGGWRETVRRHPLLWMYPAELVPSVLASLFNIAYNRTEIIDHWPGAADVFGRIIVAVNGVFFPLGMLVFALVVLPVSRGLRRLRDGERIGADELVGLRRRCLRLGGRSAWVCVGCWSVAGVVWPMVMRFVAGPPPQGSEAYLHFLASLAVCGLMASVYPYFLVTFLAVRVLYPAMLGTAPASDGPELLRLEREIGRYRVAAAVVPLFVVALLAWRGVSNPFAVAVLSVTGLAGTLVAFILEGRTRADLAALADVARSDGPR